MSDNQQASNDKAVPFFARYLEGQFCEDLSEEEMQEVKGGIRYVTLKYPSDNENGSGGTFTKKYPSDCEDGSGGAFTQKYPSDNDEYAVTQKYPSDSDEEYTVATE
ncbi:MAG: microviridin/marinostatin family tricyclic proteinase inhibitor [Scytonema sp. RU_4_4]|nr:microviridin/marinostatin family tricyclic proteinase inhibitor [Scytonema sp. RU_4_4]NJR75465.1 microviridin/marinostatin family tricyclic proteinase inhibitor [Scytonema sp. CRU_2_7]